MITAAPAAAIVTALILMEFLSFQISDFFVLLSASSSRFPRLLGYCRRFVKECPRKRVDAVVGKRQERNRQAQLGAALN